MSENRIKGTVALKEALIDAERLLSHASESGIGVEQKYIKAIIDAKKNYQINEWTEQEEIDFWIAFQALSKMVLPVTVDSIRAASTPIEPKLNWWTKIFGVNTKSQVQRTVSFFTRFALFSMIFMLAIQIYSLIGTAQLSKYETNNSRMKEIEQRMQELILITSSNPDDRTASMEQENLELENEELAKEVESGINLMRDWLNFSYNVWSEEIKPLSNAVLNKDSNPSNTPTRTMETTINIVVVQQAKSLIIILNQYILPLLYGLLGGLAFVLRSLAEESKSMTYTATSRIKYGLRIHLGALAGLVIGFLWGDFQGKSFGVAESLSPLAVAFLAGYSVDFLFRMLDSVIGSTKKKAEAEAGSDSKGEKEKK